MNDKEVHRHFGKCDTTVPVELHGSRAELIMQIGTANGCIPLIQRGAS